ncbi:MAG: DUF4192 family protein [Propionibacteriaceae bacterium]|jgi:hypothetical protein|nr:DUF4192 family protein [Propionibacteriaceae bacterium]
MTISPALAAFHRFSPTALASPPSSTSLSPPTGEAEDLALKRRCQACDLLLGEPVGAWSQRAEDLLDQALTGEPMSSADLAEWAVLLEEVAVRDRWWWRLTSRTAPLLLSLACAIVRGTPRAHRNAPIAVTAITAWVADDTVLFRRCYGELVASGERGALTALVRRIHDSPFAPADWGDLMRQARRRLNTAPPC